jgi:hypothetical protein
VSDLHPTTPVEGRSLSIPILARLAGVLWVAVGLYGVWWALVLAFVIRAFGHGHDQSHVPAQLFLASYLAVCAAVRIVRGNARGVALALCIGTFCGLLSAATELDFRDPYEKLVWWLTTLLGAPVTPRREMSPAGFAFWLILVATTIAAASAFASWRGYSRYRRQRMVQAPARRRISLIVPWVLPIAVFLIPLGLDLTSYYHILHERQFDFLFEGTLWVAILGYVPVQIFLIARRSFPEDRWLSATPLLVTLVPLSRWILSGLHEMLMVHIGILSMVALSYLWFIWLSSTGSSQSGRGSGHSA